MDIIKYKSHFAYVIFGINVQINYYSRICELIWNGMGMEVVFGNQCWQFGPQSQVEKAETKSQN